MLGPKKRNKKNEMNIDNESVQTKLTLSKLANKLNEELNKNKFLSQKIQLKKNQINQNKLFLSKISDNESIQNKAVKKLIEKELLINNNILLELNNSLKNDIKVYQNKSKNNMIILDKGTEQQRKVLETLKETNFILENMIQKKESLISRIKVIISNLLLNLDEFEILYEIDINELGMMEKESQGYMEYNHIINKELYHEFLLGKAKKFNKEKNKILRLTEEKNEYLNIINTLKKQKPKNKIENKNKIYMEKNYLNNSNGINNPTNETTENSIYDINDSLYFDTEEQMDVEFPENDFSSYYLSQKTLGLNLFKKKIVVPPLDLKLIEYTRNNAKLSFEEKSLSRDFEDDLDYKIKNIKKKIKSMDILNKNMDIKCHKYEKKIEQLALFLYTNKRNTK